MKSVTTLLATAAIAALLPVVQAFATDTIKIGVAGPLTGPNASFGEQIFNGASAYITMVNAAGGVNGKRIELIKGDDACEPKQAIAVANRFVDQDKVDAVIGHFCSSSTIPASLIYQDAGVLVMTPASTNPTVTDRGLGNLFRGCGRDDQQAVVAGAFILDTLKRDRIALVHDKDTYGQGLVDAVRKTIEARGVKPVLYEGLTRGERDFNALVTKIKSAGANAVYFGGLIPEGGALIRQIKEQGLDILVISGDSFAQTELAATAGGPANLKNVYYSATPDPLADPSTTAIQDVLNKANITPANYVLYGYANAQAVVAALQAGADLKSQADWLHNNTLDSAIGRITWDGKGDIKDFKFVFYRFNDQGTPVLIP